MKIIALFITSLIFISCADTITQINNHLPVERIAIGSGPEDIQLVTLSDKTYLLVSCLERRIPNMNGDMWLVDLQNNSSSILPRLQEPPELRFRPHGFFVSDNRHVYIINHGLDSLGNQGTEITGDAVLYYLWDGQSLIFQKIYSDPLLVNPNDIAVLPDGSFYVTNGYSNNLFSFLLQEWNLKARSIVTFYNSRYNKWSIAASCLPYSNGVHYLQNKILISTSRGKNLWMYNRNEDGLLVHPKLIASNIGLADNITEIDKDTITLTSHQSGWNFYCHAKNKNYPAPTIVWKIDVDTRKASILYANEGGKRVNAGSTAVLYQDKLYISQVFEPYIEVVSLGD